VIIRTAVSTPLDKLIVVNIHTAVSTPLDKLIVLITLRRAFL